MTLRVSSIVVLYNPSPDISSRIATYSSSVEKVFLVDNSDSTDYALVNSLQAQFSNAVYVPMGGNKGIAAALNEGFKHAIKTGANWVLTMDQDSQFPFGAVEELKLEAENVPENIAILAPYHQQDMVERRIGYQNKLIKLCMTSGNLVRIEAYKRVGGFDEKLFIDSVDHEFNLNLMRNSYLILLCGKATLFHKLGDSKITHFLGFKVRTTNHNPARRYYIARNEPYVLFKYFMDSPTLCLKILKRNIKDVLKTIMFEEQRKLKAKNVLRGWRDCIVGRWGKYPY